MRPGKNKEGTQQQFNLNLFFSHQIQNNNFQSIQNFNNSSTNITSQQIDCFNTKCYEEATTIVKLRSEIHNKMLILDQQRKKLFETISIYTKKSQEQFRDQIRGQAPERKKRNRRNADQIQRSFICGQCNKNYGTEGSLAQHAKLKHSAGQYQSKKSYSNLEHFDD